MAPRLRRHRTTAPSPPSPLRRAGFRPLRADPLADFLRRARAADPCSISGSASSVRAAAAHTAPAAAAVEQLRPRHAEEQDRYAGRQERHVSMRSRRTSSPHWMSSKTATSGLSAATASSSLRNAHAISSASRALASRGRRRAPPRATGSSSSRGRCGSSCLSTSTIGHYVIPPRTRGSGPGRPSRPSPPGTPPRAATCPHPLRHNRDQLALRRSRTRSQASASVQLLLPSHQGESNCRCAGVVDTATSRQAGTGSALPTPEARRARSRQLLEPDAASSRRAGLTGLRRPCSLAATLTASPVASRSSVPVTTSPVQMPIRPSMPSSGMATCISAAAWSARTASSSCTAGTPKTAITASPMNFSTVPPWLSMIDFICSKYRASSPRSASG